MVAFRDEGKLLLDYIGKGRVEISLTPRNKAEAKALNKVLGLKVLHLAEFGLMPGPSRILKVLQVEGCYQIVCLSLVLDTGFDPEALALAAISKTLPELVPSSIDFSMERRGDTARTLVRVWI